MRRSAERRGRHVTRCENRSSFPSLSTVFRSPFSVNLKNPPNHFFPTRHANETKPNGLMMKLVSSTASSSLREAGGPARPSRACLGLGRTAHLREMLRTFPISVQSSYSGICNKFPDRCTLFLESHHPRAGLPFHQVSASQRPTH